MTLVELEQCFGEDFDNMFAGNYKGEQYLSKNWLEYDVVKGWFVKYMLQREFALNEEKIIAYEKVLNIRGRKGS